MHALHSVHLHALIVYVHGLHADADDDEVSCASASGEIDEAMERCLDAMSRLSMADEPECPMCLEPLRECGTVMRLQCGHLMCKLCLDGWQRQCFDP